MIRIDNLILQAAKAEKGAIFTGWPVWNYALELAKCQRYFYRIPEVIADGFISAAGIVNAAASSGYTVLNFPVPMRTKPILKYSGNIVLYIEGKLYEFDTLSLWTETNKEPSYCIMRANLQNTAIAGKPFLIKVGKGAWLEFNANL